MILLNNLHNMKSLSLSDLVLSTPSLLISFSTSICCSPSDEIPIVNWTDEQGFFTAKRYGSLLVIGYSAGVLFSLNPFSTYEMYEID